MRTLYLLAALLTISHFSFGQCKYLINKADEFTGAFEKQTDIVSIGKNAYGSVGRTDSIYYVAVAAPGIGCVTPGKSRLYIKFTDNTVLEVLHTHKVSCSNMPSIIGYINDDLEALRTKTVARGRISGTEGNVDFDFKDPEYFKKALKCIE